MFASFASYVTALVKEHSVNAPHRHRSCMRLRIIATFSFQIFGGKTNGSSCILCTIVTTIPTLEYTLHCIAPQLILSPSHSPSQPYGARARAIATALPPHLRHITVSTRDTLFIVGDVHGCADELKLLLKKKPLNARVVFVG